MQWFWEVFPARDGLTTYMFSYVDPAKGKPPGMFAVPEPCSSLAVQGSMALADESCMPADAVKCGGKAALSWLQAGCPLRRPTQSTCTCCLSTEGAQIWQAFSCSVPSLVLCPSELHLAGRSREASVTHCRPLEGRLTEGPLKGGLL